MSYRGYFSELYKQVKFLKEQEIEYAKFLLSDSINDYHLKMIRCNAKKSVIDNTKDGIISLVVGMLEEEYPDINQVKQEK